MMAMNLTDIPLFAMLKNRMGYLSERQNVIAENIANANTPGYVAQDVKPFSFDAHMRGAGGATSGPMLAASAPAVTRANHLAGSPMKTGSDQKYAKPIRAGDSETTLDGNAVVLEDQMMKLTETRMEYDAAIGFYQKSMSLLRMAARRPGA